MLKETHEGESLVMHGSPNIENPEFFDNINIDIYIACKGYFVTPYKAFLNIKRILDQYSLIMSNDKTYFFGDEGEFTIPLSQFSDPSLEKESKIIYLYFSYVMDEFGYEVYAEITDEEGLEEISQIESND